MWSTAPEAKVTPMPVIELCPPHIVLFTMLQLVDAALNVNAPPALELIILLEKSFPEAVQDIPKFESCK
jgi:hypothetical protein